MNTQKQWLGSALAASMLLAATIVAAQSTDTTVTPAGTAASANLPSNSYSADGNMNGAGMNGSPTTRNGDSLANSNANYKSSASSTDAMGTSDMRAPQADRN